MAMQILTGSKGTYEPSHDIKTKFGDTTFVVTQDICASLDYVIGRFTDGCVDARIDKSRIIWTHLKTEDFQGA